MKTILIVEDEESISTLLKDIFSYVEEYRVLCASDGEEALEMIRMAPPDIILLDAQLPGINGFEICHRLKADPITSSIKVLMLTGMIQSYYLKQAQKAGADGYLVKPFNSVELLDKVQACLS